MANVRQYEALVLLDIGAGDEKLEEVIKKLEQMITDAEGSEILNIDRWGKKRLAYEIKKRQFGYYVLLEFKAPSTIPTEIDRYCRFEPAVLRHLVLHIPTKVLKLKEKEGRIKAAMDHRRQREEGEEPIVEDMLEPLEDDELADHIEDEVVEVEKPGGDSEVKEGKTAAGDEELSGDETGEEKKEEKTGD